MSNVIKLAAKEEAAEGHRIPKEIQKELNRKKRQQKQTEAAPSEKGYRKGQQLVRQRHTVCNAPCLLGSVFETARSRNFRLLHVEKISL